ncbi:hypothetical protein [Pajaroellobacter abortibovis]|uniref:Uncharacterized protein n=1 Tax=Pajaroellobacter abortibovis TaxID=1882918 RepID=A0A1L6MXH8_9BACT|nr:hypothetical protein [Pajaroellobacter abortibovis]APS00234.1 hypothetical protein BCY86_05715 [Pajaroellobacter abortibovis]
MNILSEGEACTIFLGSDNPFEEIGENWMSIQLDEKQWIKTLYLFIPGFFGFPSVGTIKLRIQSDGCVFMQAGYVQRTIHGEMDLLRSGLVNLMSNLHEPFVPQKGAVVRLMVDPDLFTMRDGQFLPLKDFNNLGRRAKGLI